MTVNKSHLPIIIGSILFVLYLILLSQKIATPSSVSVVPLLPTQVPSPTVSIPNYNGHYLSQQFGFSFDYPPEYSLNENYPTPDHRSYYVSVMSPIDLTDRKGYDLQDGELKIEIYINPNDKNQTLDQIYSQAKQDALTNTSDIGGKILSEKKMVISGTAARSIAWEGVGSGNTIYLLKNNYLFTIVQYPAITGLQSNADQIIKSLKFIDQDVIGWDNKSIPIVRGEFRHYTTSDGCVYLVIDQPVTTDKSLEQYVIDYSSAWSDNFPRNEIQYTHPQYSVITLPAMNAAEISNIFIKTGDSVYKMTASVGIPEGPPRCRSNYDQELSVLIKSLKL